jgi:uncharacterized protein YutE (UPF0331/DUF86 family)
MDRTILRKAESISRCIKRIEQERQFNLFEDIVHQDALLLNLQRACQTTIDMALHIVKTKQLGVPNSTSDVFEILFEQKLIPFDLYESMRSMVGFRNIMVHDYTELDLNIVRSIVDKHLDDFRIFSQIALNIK